MTTVNKEDSTSVLLRSAFQELLLELSLLSDFVLTQVHICIPVCTSMPGCSCNVRCQGYMSARR